MLRLSLYSWCNMYKYNINYQNECNKIFFIIDDNIRNSEKTNIVINANVAVNGQIFWNNINKISFFFFVTLLSFIIFILFF